MGNQRLADWDCLTKVALAKGLEVEVLNAGSKFVTQTRSVSEILRSTSLTLRVSMRWVLNAARC